MLYGILPSIRGHLALSLLALLIGAVPVAPVHADEPEWKALISADSPTLQRLANQQYTLFQHFIEQSLHGKGLADFEQVSEQVENNIGWRNRHGKNAYNEAYLRSYPFLKKHDLQGMPDIIMLIPYLESQWSSKKGTPSADYGYWQMVKEVIQEIQTLEHAPQSIRTASPNKVRTNAYLSTQAAQIHLRRYYFYFAKVAGFSETDAWLLTMVSYNWGAGNVKRLLASLEAKGIKPNFSTFYHALYKTHQASPDELSLRAAVEYLPSLWNIAKVIKASN